MNASPAEATYLAQDTPCVSCGYNLRGLAIGGACPECGAEVAQALRGDPLIAADLDWLTRIVRGQALVAWTLLGCFIFACASMVALPVFRLFELNMNWLVDSLLVITAIVAFLLCALGAYFLTAREPQFENIPEGLSRRRAARGLVAVAVAELAVLVMIYLQIIQGTVSYQTGFKWFAIGFTVALLNIAAVTVAILLHVVALARRVPRVRLAERLSRVVDRYLFVVFALLATGLVEAAARTGHLPYYIGNIAWVGRWVGTALMLFYSLRMIEVMVVAMRAFRMCLRVARRRNRQSQLE